MNVRKKLKSTLDYYKVGQGVLVTNSVTNYLFIHVLDHMDQVLGTLIISKCNEIYHGKSNKNSFIGIKETDINIWGITGALKSQLKW